MSSWLYNSQGDRFIFGHFDYDKLQSENLIFGKFMYLLLRHRHAWELHLKFFGYIYNLLMYLEKTFQEEIIYDFYENFYVSTRDKHLNMLFTADTKITVQ